jgi:hypothetical protein
VQLEPAVTRRIAGLARHAHAFHRFAHHPLCDRYRGELIALRGNTRVCRGCASALGGTVLGTVAALSLHLPVAPVAALSFASGLCLAGSLIALRRKPTPRRGARISKLISRGIPAALTSASLVALLMAAAWSRFALLLGATALCVRAYRRRGPDRSPCLQCPERIQSEPCSGYAPIVRAERAFRRRAHQLLDLETERDGSSHKLQSDAGASQPPLEPFRPCSRQLPSAP